MTRSIFAGALVFLTIILHSSPALGSNQSVPFIRNGQLPGYTCGPDNPCALACCSPFGFCGYGPKFCALNGNPETDCIPELSQHQTCNLTSPCDPGGYPYWINSTWGPTYAEHEACPLNVCCSPFGFCGTTEVFCGNTTVPQPDTNKTDTSFGRTIGYYEGWSVGRPCDQMTPSQIPLDAYTHLLYSFLSINPNTFELEPASPQEIPLFSEFTALKHKKPGMEVWLSIGGWAFTDWPGPTAFTFSKLVGSLPDQTTFFKSLTDFMTQYGFDGIDMDWEYPVTPDRNGSVLDFDNYISFMHSLREHLNVVDPDFGLSMTIPSSYWYMQNFDIIKFAEIIDWFNVMTYDLHGTWDSFDPYIGNHMLAHTNLTEIKMTIDLLWRNDIDPEKVSMGYGFYGRSFTAEDPSCMEAGCPFSSGSNAGPCTQAPGILSYLEIQTILNDPSRNAVITLDPVAAVQIVTWDTDQWVSFDNEETIKMKQAYANRLGIGGQMVWAVSLDSPCGDAASYLANHSNQCILDAQAVTSSMVDMPPAPTMAINTANLTSPNPTGIMPPPLSPSGTGLTGACKGILGALRCGDKLFGVYSWAEDCQVGNIEPCEGDCAECMPVVDYGAGGPGGEDSECHLVRFDS